MGDGSLRVLGLFLGSTGPAGISGAERFVLEVWSRWLGRMYCSITVIASTPGYLRSQKFGYALPMDVVRAGARLGPPPYIGYFARTIDATRHALRYEPDVIFAGSPYFFDLLPAIVMKMLHKKIVLAVPVFHLIPPPHQRPGRILINILAWIENQLMLRLVVKFSDLVVTASQDVTVGLSHLGLPRSRIFLTPLGVRRARRARPTTEPRFDALWLGRFSPAKGTVELLQAWRVVCDKIPAARLALVGGDLPGFCVSREIAQLKLENNIVIYEDPEDEQVEQLMMASRCFVTASREEGYGLAVAEALAMGLPCVTYNVDIFKAWFPRGRIYPTLNNPTELGLCILRLLETPALQRRLVDELTSGLDLPTWESIADILWDRCAGLLREKRSSRLAKSQPE